MRALITGVLGQDGSYLAGSLVADGHEVVGTRRSSEVGELGGCRLVELDLLDRPAIGSVVADVEPDVVFHLAGLSSVAAAWAEPVLAMDVNATATVALLESCWELQERSGRAVRFVQASSAEIFGAPATAPQDETTPLAPVNPYGASKALAHLAVGVYRARGLGASSMVLYNHESPRRPETFVTRKITATVARIARGEASELRLGNLAARRDWGYAPDYVAAMRLAAGAEPGDFVVASGVAHSVADFVRAAFESAGVDDWERYVVVDPAFYRPVDAVELVGDASRAREVLGWRPTVSFDELVALMVEADLHG